MYGSDVENCIRHLEDPSDEFEINMRQMTTESNDHYVERFKANAHTVEVDKGGHFSCSRELIYCEDDDDHTTAETVKEEHKLKAIILLRRVDEARYKKVISDLKYVAHLGRDEYPTSVAGTFDLLNRRSSQIDF